MSDSISTPAPAVAPTPAVVPGVDAPTAPPPATQSPLSISEAGRLLNQQRRQQAQERRTEAPQARTNDVSVTPDNGAVTPPQPEPSRRPPDSLSDMAKALGLPEGATPPTPSAESTPAAPMAATVEIDGRSFTHDQLRTLIGQGTDYTRKTQALAEQGRQLQAQQEALAAVLPYIQPELARVQQQIAGVAAPDASLIDSAPQEYLRQLAAYQSAQAEQQRLGQLGQLQQAAMQRALAQKVEESNAALAQQFPQWGDPATRSVWQREIGQWAMQKAGFQHQELQGLADHRQLLTMMKAMMWDRMVDGAKTSAPVQRAPARGAAPPPAPAQAVSDAEAAFGDRPNIRNAAMLLAARRAGGR